MREAHQQSCNGKHLKWLPCNKLYANIHSPPNDICFFDFCIYSSLVAEVSLSPQNWVSVKSYRRLETGKSVSRDNPSRRPHVDWAIWPTWQSKLFVSVCSLTQWLFEPAVVGWLIRWLGYWQNDWNQHNVMLVQSFWHRNFNASSCECVLVVWSVKLPNSLALSALVLFIFHRVLMPSFHTSSKQPYVLQVFLDWFYTVISEQIKCLSLTFRWQCNDHCILMQGYKDIYLPVTCKCTQEFVLVTFHSYSALTNRQSITIIHV